MFHIDRAANRLNKLTVRRFGDLGLRERNHLQEWLANTPAALGEELLIIQKEFAGFDGTQERLDLLALDKFGGLVVIENKLDDSGRDVVWQALKYAAYVSRLSKSDIVSIYQRHLDRLGGGDASERICAFLEVEALDEEVVLNKGADQRIILVSARFRKEVTSTALWLHHHGVRLQCFTATPYAFGEDLLLDVQQIIPVAEAEEFMIGLASKETEERAAQTEAKTRHHVRQAFWQQALDVMRREGVTPYQNISPSRDSWLSASTGVPGVSYHLIFNKHEARVDLYIGHGAMELNKWLFDRLLARKAEIEADFGAPLNWQRLDDGKASKIGFGQSFDCHSSEHWPEVTAWLVDHFRRFEAALRQPFQDLAPEMRARRLGATS